MLKTMFPTLARVRLLVQLAMLVFLVYGSTVVGHYAAEKISGALPLLRRRPAAGAAKEGQ